jgi:hypothetical protein
MHFRLPSFPCFFEIPDDWLDEAGMRGFSAVTSSYRSTEAGLVSIEDIEPPRRLRTVPKDYRGFDRARMVSVLKGIVAGAEIEPVPLVSIPELDDRLVGTLYRYRTYSYRIRDGVHRFYAS